MSDFSYSAFQVEMISLYLWVQNVDLGLLVLLLLSSFLSLVILELSQSYRNGVSLGSRVVGITKQNENHQDVKLMSSTKVVLVVSCFLAMMLFNVFVAYLSSLSLSRTLTLLLLVGLQYQCNVKLYLAVICVNNGKRMTRATLETCYRTTNPRTTRLLVVPSPESRACLDYRIFARERRHHPTPFLLYEL
jgi:hypothetical protein